MGKVKFPLEMANGKMVRNLQELRENFDINKIISHFMNGSLLRWLEERYYDEECEKLRQIKQVDSDTAGKLCEVFGVKEEIVEKSFDDIFFEEKLKNELSLFLDNSNELYQIDKSMIACTQKELDRLINDKASMIYLFDGIFDIPTNYENVKYIGLKNVVVRIASSRTVPFESKNIIFKNISFDANYKKCSDESIYQRNVYWRFFTDESGVLKFASKQNQIMGYHPEDIPRMSNRIIWIDECCDSYRAIDEDGNLYKWGRDLACGVSPKLPPLKQIRCSNDGYYALGKNGVVYGWGDFSFVFHMPNNLPPIKYLVGNHSQELIGLGYDARLYALCNNEKICSWVTKSKEVNVKKAIITNENLYVLSEDNMVYSIGEECERISKEINDITYFENGILALKNNGDLLLFGNIENDELYKNEIGELPPIKRIVDNVRWSGFRIYGIDKDNNLCYTPQDYSFVEKYRPKKICDLKGVD